MAIKGKKRPAESSNVLAKTNDEQQPTKKKVKVQKTKPVVQTNGVASSKQKKTEPKQKSVVNNKNTTVIKSANTTVAPKAPVKAEKKDIASKDVVKNDDDGAKLAALIKRKAKRKIQRQKKIEGFAPELIKASPEELQKRIDDIVSREKITRTARRRLGVLKKKLSIKQGTYTPSPTKQAPTMTKNTKRRLRRMKKALGIKDDDESETSPVEEVKNKAEKAAKAVKGLKASVAEKKAAQNSKIFAKNDKIVDKKQKQVDGKMKVKKEKVKVVVKEASEEDDEDDEDEEQNESMDVSNNSINTNDDNDDDEDDDEEVDVKKPISKPKKGNKQINTKPEKKVIENGNKKEKPGPNKPVGNAKATPKKSRYVLFVGNIPLTSGEDEIKKHFLTKVSDVLSVRIPQDAQNNPRGFCYVEFSNSVDFEKGLSLHETQFRGNRIRVQYSGPKDERKKFSAVGKNKKLHALRKQGKLAGSTKDSQKRNARRNKGKDQAA